MVESSKIKRLSAPKHQDPSRDLRQNISSNNSSMKKQGSTGKTSLILIVIVVFFVITHSNRLALWMGVALKPAVEDKWTSGKRLECCKKCMGCPGRCGRRCRCYGSACKVAAIGRRHLHAARPPYQVIFDNPASIGSCEPLRQDFLWKPVFLLSARTQ